MKTGLSNFLGLYTIKFANMLAPLIYIPIASEVLPVIEQDIFFVILTLIGLNFIFVEFSGTITGYRFFHENKVLKSESDIFHEVLVLRVIICFVTSLGSCIYMASLAETSSYLWFTLFLLNNLGYVFYSTWYSLVKNKLSFNSFIILLARALPIIPMAFGFLDSTAYNFFLYISISYFALSIFELTRIKKSNDLKLLLPLDIKTYFKKSYSIFIADTAPNLYNNIPIMIAPIVHGPSGFAAFFIANKISSFLIQTSSLLASALMPTIDPKDKIPNNYIVLFIVCLFLGACTVFMASKFLTSLISDLSLYEEVYFQWLMASIIPVSMVHFINLVILIPNDEIRIYKKSSIYTSLIFGIVSIYFSYIYGVEILPVMLFSSRVGLLVITLYYAKSKIYTKLR